MSKQGELLMSRNLPTRVVARTFQMEGNKQLTEREYDFADRSARELLSKHIIHCVNNGKGVQIFNAKDEGK